MNVKLRTGVVVSLGVALVLAIGFVLIGFLAPVIASETTTSDGAGDGTPTGITLVAALGPSVLGIVLAPLVVTLVVAGCLAFRDRYPVLGPLAWIAAGGLALVGVAGLLSVGIFILPVAIALLVAITLDRRGAAATA